MLGTRMRDEYASCRESQLVGSNDENQTVGIIDLSEQYLYLQDYKGFGRFKRGIIHPGYIQCIVGRSSQSVYRYGRLHFPQPLKLRTTKIKGADNGRYKG